MYQTLSKMGMFLCEQLKDFFTQQYAGETFETVVAFISDDCQ